MKEILFVSALLLLTACQDKTDTPRYTAGIFCNFTKTAHFDAPEEILTADLIQEIATAKEKNAKIIDTAPDQKPPLGDGIPYQSYPDIAPDCEIGTVTNTGEEVKVEIKHIFPNEPKADWSDFLVLKHLNEQWKIDDVIYEKADSKESLRSALISLFEK